SSLYGSDAIAGVVNFITKKTHDGAAVTVQGVSPQQSGGAHEGRFSIIGGKGNLEADGWSLYATLDAHKQTALPYSARPDWVNTAELNSLGIGPGNKAAGSGGYAWPANIISPSSAAGNPYGSTCLPPYSTPAAKNTCQNNNTQLYGVLFPESQQLTFFSNGQLKLSNDNTLSMEISYGNESRIEPRGAASTSVGFTPPPGGGPAPAMIITSSSPYYPGGSAGVPKVKGVTGQPLTLEWQDDAQGGATYKDTQANSRLLVSDVGQFHGWDFKANLVAAHDERTDKTLSGYLNGPALDAGVLNGTINPFGAQNAAGAAYLAGISENGQNLRDTTSGFDSIDFSASHDLMQLSGGALAVNLGTSFHHDTMHDNSPQNNINIPYNGRQPYDVHASRNIASLFGEVDMPMTRQVDLDFAIRADDYSDIGSSVNPKLSLRYQPTDMLVLRTSYNTGFRAPSLIDMYGYRLAGATTTTSAKWDDPLLCPGTGAPGTGTITAAALAAGITSGQVCNIKQPVQTGSNPNLEPEKSKNFTMGFVFEPVKSFSLTMDYWHIELRDTLGSLSETAIFQNPTLYAANFVRNPNGLLAYINEDTQNLGGTNTSGEDVDLLYKSPQTTAGKFLFDLRGTYTNRYEQQTMPSAPWTSNVGRFGGVTLGTYSNNPLLTFRWKHNAMLSWLYGNWNTVLSENYQSGYHDQNSAVTSQYYRDISSYSVTSITTTYTGIKNLVLSAGISNVFNAPPPETNSQATGILLDYASAVGRAYIVSATYKFF
ncbi:MAG TPA: TonB-dependent receptor, partial [Burkholderiaceae bacterium]